MPIVACTSLHPKIREVTLIQASIYFLVCPSINLSTYLPTSLSILLSTCIYLYLSIYLSIYLRVYMCIHIYICIYNVVVCSAQLLFVLLIYAPPPGATEVCPRLLPGA